MFIMQKNPINEVRVADMTKEQLKSFVRDVLNDELSKDKNKILKQEDIKNIVRDMLKKHYRTLWSNSAFYLDKL